MFTRDREVMRSLQIHREFRARAEAAGQQQGRGGSDPARAVEIAEMRLPGTPKSEAKARAVSPAGRMNSSSNTSPGVSGGKAGSADRRVARSSRRITVIFAQ
jgi:hypothetical protein